MRGDAVGYLRGFGVRLAWGGHTERYAFSECNAMARGKKQRFRNVTGRLAIYRFSSSAKNHGKTPQSYD